MAVQPQPNRAALADRLSRYREQMLEISQTLGFDPSGEGRPAEIGLGSRRLSGGASPCRPESGRQCVDLQKSEWLMKRLKLATTEAEYMLAVSEGCTNGLVCEPGNMALESSRQEAKRHTKALKTEFKVQQEACQKLQAGCIEASSAAEANQSECFQAMQNIAQYQQFSGGGSGKETEITWASGPHRQASDELDRAVSVETRLAQKIREEKLARLDLKREHDKLEKELEQLQAKTVGVICREQETNKQIARGEEVNQAEEQLGLCAVDYDDERGVVVLGSNHNSMIKCAGTMYREVDLLTIAAQCNQEGRLVHAEAHPVLDLKAAVETAVDADDLPHLLTEVWHKVRELDHSDTPRGTPRGTPRRRRSSAGGGQRRSSHGGA